MTSIYTKLGCSLDVRKYCKTSNISCTVLGNKIVDNSDAVGASLLQHLHSQLYTWFQWIERRQLQEYTRNI